MKMIDGVYLNTQDYSFSKESILAMILPSIYVYMLLQLLMYLLPKLHNFFFFEILISLFFGDILEANRNLLSGSRLALVSMDHCVA